MEQNGERKYIQSIRIEISEAVPGMVLAEAIQNNAGGTVISGDSILSKKSILRLKESGISHIYIEKAPIDRQFDLLHGKRAIIVEDSLFFRHMFAKTLYNMGIFVCEELENAEDILSCSRRYKPYLVLMDIHLPGISGIEAISKLHAIMPETKIIAASTDHDKTTIINALKVGAVDFILKPVRWDLLKPRIMKQFSADQTEAAGPVDQRTS